MTPLGANAVSDLQRWLERATKLFAQDERYKRHDARYLRLWLAYIELCCAGQPREQAAVFAHMAGSDIGTGLAAFWEAWATFLVDVKAK